MSTINAMHTIAVVAIESPPLLVHPQTAADSAAVRAVGLVEPGPGGTGYLYIPLPLFCPLCSMAQISISFAASSAPKSGEHVTMTTEAPPAWMPTRGLSASAVQQMKRTGRPAFVVDGYGLLPVTDRSVNVYLENWMAPVRRWYNSETSPIDYGSIQVPRADAVLEVGVLNYEYMSGDRLVMQVMLKLVDPATKQVLGNARCGAYPKGGSLAEMLSDGGRPLQRLVETTDDELLSRCLRDLGLIAD